MFISSESLWDFKEPTHNSRRVGDEVPGVVAVLWLCVYGWVGIAGPHHLNSCHNFNLLKQINNKQTNEQTNKLWKCELHPVVSKALDWKIICFGVCYGVVCSAKLPADDNREDLLCKTYTRKLQVLKEKRNTSREGKWIQTWPTKIILRLWIDPYLEMTNLTIHVFFFPRPKEKRKGAVNILRFV